MIKRNLSGWIPQGLDKRDYTLKKAFLEAATKNLPAKMDLRPKCAPVEDQGQRGTCTWFAYCGVARFMENQEGHGSPEFSENFGYYETVKNIEHGNPMDDPGATIRDTFVAGKKYGVCLNPTWPYDDAHFGKAPSAAAVKEALNYQLKSYVSLDPQGASPTAILSNVKAMIASGIPVEFGFAVYSSFLKIGKDGLMSFPKSSDTLEGGHAVGAFGYDDTKVCPNTKTPGAFLVRNSWGIDWGLVGYFWMPYEILTVQFKGEQMASDFWGPGPIEWMNKGVN